VELVGHIPDVERDPEHIGGAARVAGVLDRAAAARTRPVRLRVAGQGQVHARHVVTSVDRSRGRNRRVDAARHGGQHLHVHL
jgi:hypothetical protein